MVEKTGGWFRATLFTRENGIEMVPAPSRSCYTGWRDPHLAPRDVLSPASHVLSSLLLFQLGLVSGALHSHPPMSPDLAFAAESGD